MEKSSSRALTSSLQNFHLNKEDPKTNTLQPHRKTIYQRSIASKGKIRRPSLVGLCLGVLGKHFEDIIEDLSEITTNFSPETKMAMVAIARRRKLLNDNVLSSLADSSWGVLDISGSDVSDFGLTEVAKICESLRAIDISCCGRITAVGVSELLSHCHLLETLRCGGCGRSDRVVRGCLSMLTPKLNDVEVGESWEELESKEICTDAAKSLRWLLWAKVDEESRERLATECPRIIVNPKASPFSWRGVQVPNEAIAEIALDEHFVEDVDPKTWAEAETETETAVASSRVVSAVVPSEELPMAERFRLAFVERDERLAPKRAKNARQHRRRAAREWTMTDAQAKSLLLASKLGGNTSWT